jgi:hypothetical protein
LRYLTVRTDGAVMNIPVPREGQPPVARVEEA